MNGGELASTLSQLSARDQVSARVVCKRWLGQSRSAAILALSRYLPEEVIDTLASPLHTLNCFERLFYDEIEHYNSSVSSHQLHKLRHTYLYSSLALDLLCFPYKDENRNRAFLEKMTAQSREQQINIFRTVIYLHNIHLYRALGENVQYDDIALFMRDAYASGNLVAFRGEHHYHNAQSFDMLSALSSQLRFTSHPGILHLILEPIDIPDMLIHKIKHLSRNPSVLYLAKHQAERIFPELRANDVLDVYTRLQGQEIRRARVAIFLSGNVGLVRQMIDHDVRDERSDRQYNVLETRLMILFAIYHNDKTLFDYLINTFPRVVNCLEEDYTIFFEAISIFRSWNILPWVNDQCDKIFDSQVSVSVPFSLVTLHPFITKRLVEGWLSYDPHFLKALNNRSCEWGNTRILRLLFSENNLPDQGDLSVAVRAGNVSAIKVLFEINPDLKVLPIYLYYAAFYNNIPLLKFLIENGLQPDQFAFNIAVYVNACDMVAYLSTHHQLLADEKTVQILNSPNRSFIDLYGESEDMIQRVWSIFHDSEPSVLYSRESMVELIESLTPVAEMQTAMTT